jgi:peroxiredoxin Q/BCP
MKKIFLVWFFHVSSLALGLEVGSKAPLFSTKNDSGQTFELKQNENKTWTVLYFYPKAETPGCTKQACAFRDAIKVIQAQNAQVYGVSTDSVTALTDFKKNHKLTFDLLSDGDGKISEAYGAKMPLLTVSKRHTFLIDPSLVIRSIDRDVDPALDAQKVADALAQLQKNPVKK